VRGVCDHRTPEIPMPAWLASLPLWMHVTAFCAAAFVTWRAGTCLSVYAKQIAERTRAGQALVGTLLLGGVASVPELMMSITGAALGDAQLATTTLLGGVPVTMAMVAISDAAAGLRPVSSRVTRPVVLMQGTLLIAMLTLLAFGMVTRDLAFAHAGVWSLLLLAFYVGAVITLRKHEQDPPSWTPDHTPSEPGQAPSEPGHSAASRAGDEPQSLSHVLAACGLAGLATIAAGYVLAISSAAIAEQTGLGSTLVGMVLGGIATSLPELSTIRAAVKLRQYEMAFGDAFGSNLCSIALLYFADLAYPEGALLNQVTASSLLATLLGILSAAIYLGGLLRRARVTVLRLGIDSLLALAVYVLGLVLIYRLG
jgi:cation:H+ antiporter